VADPFRDPSLRDQPAREAALRQLSLPRASIIPGKLANGRLGTLAGRGVHTAQIRYSLRNQSTVASSPAG
jgi:hypothetical protein